MGCIKDCHHVTALLPSSTQQFVAQTCYKLLKIVLENLQHVATRISCVKCVKMVLHLKVNF